MKIEDKAYFLFDTPGMSQKEKDKRAKYWLALEKQQAKKAMEDWRFAVAQEERYMGSVFVTPGRQREMEARTQAAYLKAKKLNPDYQGFSMPVEDKAYFDKRIEVETWKSPKGTTYIAGLDQGSGGLFQPFITATYSDGGQQLMTGNPPKFKTEGGARKWLSAEITRRKTPNARQGSKAKFYLDPSNIQLILKQIENENRQITQSVKQKQASGKKSDLMDATNLAHGMAYSNATANTIQDLRKILKSKNPADKQAAQQALSKIEAIESFWQAKHTELQSQYRAAHSRTGTKSKFEKEWTEAGFSASFFIKKLQGMMAVYQGENDNEYRNKIIGYAKTLANHPDFVFNGVSSQALAKKAFTLVKFKYARQGSKAKFAKEYILWALPKGETDRLHERPIAEGLYTPAQVDDVKRKATAAGWHSFRVAAMMGFDDMTNAFKGKSIKKGSSRQGSKAKFANFKVGQIVKYKNPNSDEDPNQKYIIKEVNGDRGFMETHGGYFKDSRFPPRMLYQQNEIMLASRTGTKTKFANRGAFAEASSSPVLGSLLEKKVMPEGGWRAVETDGAALVIAFEDNDIAGNFARRAAENGYSATAPMAMAGRYWNVKVQNENKN